MASQVSLILGGVRSGKSAFAERLTDQMGRPTLYIATGVVGDGEMEARINQHRRSRPDHWVILEEPLGLAESLEVAMTAPTIPGAVLIDSMDAWVSNMMLEHKGDSSESLTELVLSVVDQLLEVCRRFPSAYFLVSGEVGLSLVPPYPLGRRFQDLLGLVNQRIAASVDRCYLVVAGMPIEVNRPADS